MSAVPLRNNKAAASAIRSVSVLGATGSIGDSTMDLLRGAPERYQVEALTANTNVAALAKLAKEFDARFAAIADPNLLEDLHALEDLERVKSLFDDLETKRGVIDLLGRAESAEGVRIFIGSENKLFSLSGSSTIIAPYSDAAGHIVGVLGVIGPTRLNYARVIPTVDYAARIVSRMLGG